MPRGIRFDPRHDAKTRAKIQTSQIVNRLQHHIKGDVEMKPSAVTAALGLLKKTIPDLSSVDIKGQGEDGALVIQVVKLGE